MTLILKTLKPNSRFPLVFSSDCEKMFLIGWIVFTVLQSEPPITALHLSLAAAQDAWPSRDTEWGVTPRRTVK